MANGNNLVSGLINPRMRGIFDGPDEEKKAPSLGDALGQVFGGVNDPRLSPEQNAAAGRAGRMQAGLATMLASGSRGLGESLATGALVGQQAGGAQRQALVEQSAARKRLAAISQALGSDELDRGDVGKAIQVAVRAGDSDSARMLIDLMKTLPEPEPNDPGLKLVTIEGEGYLADQDMNLFDPFTREPITAPPADQLEPGGSFRKDVYDEDSGQMITINFQTDASGRVVGQQVLGVAEAPESLKRGDLAGMANQLRQEFGTLRQIIDEHGVPNELQVRAPNRVQGALGPWIQQYESAGGKINILASRLMFGARVSDSEREALSEVLTPRPGDSEEVIEQKISGLELLIADFERGQGIYDPNGEEGTERYIEDPSLELSTFSW